MIKIVVNIIFFCCLSVYGMEEEDDGIYTPVPIKALFEELKSMVKIYIENHGNQEGVKYKEEVAYKLSSVGSLLRFFSKYYQEQGEPAEAIELPKLWQPGSSSTLYSRSESVASAVLNLLPSGCFTVIPSFEHDGDSFCIITWKDPTSKIWMIYVRYSALYDTRNIWERNYELLIPYGPRNNFSSLVYLFEYLAEKKVLPENPLSQFRAARFKLNKDDVDNHFYESILTSTSEF